MAKQKTFSKAQIFLSNGYRWDLYLDDELQDVISNDWREAIEKEYGTFWLGNWGVAIEAHLYDAKNRHIKVFKEDLKNDDMLMPEIIISQVVTYTGI